MEKSSIPTTRVVYVDDNTYDLFDRGVTTDENFVRPRGLFARFINRGLGPLPVGLMKLNDISAQWMFIKRWQRVVGSISAIIVWFAMAVLMTVFPWMIMSPFSIVANLFSGRGVGQSSPIVTLITLAIIAVALVVSLIWFRSFRRYLVKMALIEEMWFRAGAERWSPVRRVFSCIAFSFAHILNLIYPIGVLIVLVIAGAIFMIVYLRVYDKTGDTYEAVLASARVHAVYNITSVYWVVGVIVVMNVVQLTA